MDSFTPQYFTPDETTSEPDSSKSAQEFQLPDLDAGNTGEKESFSFDNEIQRNFDPTNVKKAQEGVQEIIKDAMDRIKIQADRIRLEARGEGFAEGQKEGFQAGEQFAREEFTPFLETLEKLVEELSDFRQKMFPKVEREMVNMIVQLTKKVIHAELTTREDSIQDVIRLAVQSVLDRERMVIKVNPGDQIHAETYRPELHHLFNEIKNITIEGQPSIERGGCIIETNFGIVDAQIHNLEEQIDRILGIAPPPGEEVKDASGQETPSDTGNSDPNFPLEPVEPESDESDEGQEGSVNHGSDD